MTPVRLEHLSFWAEPILTRGEMSSDMRFPTMWYAGLEIFFWTYSSCGASGLNFSLVLTPVELALKSGILKETKHIIQ